MRIPIILLLFCCLAQHLFSVNKPIDITATGLPVNAVIHYYEQIIDVQSPAKMEISYRKEISILNAEGVKDFAQIVLVYDKFKSIDDAKLLVKDASGKLIKTYRQKKFNDLAYLDELTLADDTRYLHVDLSNEKLPFTIELSYKERFSGILTYPDFIPQTRFNVSVEKARCEIRIPDDQTLYFRNNLCPEPEISKENGSSRLVWSIGPLSAIPEEPYNLPIEQLTAHIRFSPGQFEISGYTGSYKSWEDFAAWNHQMISSLSSLDQNTVNWIKDQTDGLDDLQKIKKVYKLLQNSTRYVSIPLGIGGWKPLDPNFVQQNKFGDCKALSWYTKSLLEAAGIPSYYTLIYSGKEPVTLDPSFPETVFNHVILTVPVENSDTIWLECTAQSYPFGYVGKHIADRYALLIGDEHGKIIHLPEFTYSSNIQVDSVLARIEEDNNTTNMKWYSSYKGLAIENDRFLSAYYIDSTEQNRWLINYKSIEGAEITGHNITLDQDDNYVPSGQLEVHAILPRLVKKTASRIYFIPNFFSPWSKTLPGNTNRISPVSIRYGETSIADLQFQLPVGYVPERMPEPVFIDTEFGSYKLDIRCEQGTLFYRRSIELKSGVYSPEKYSELVDLFSEMTKRDAERVVFKKE
ncbi:MAG: DUF3857 domain-containing protein [Saprospiraceae bacterium]